MHAYHRLLLLLTLVALVTTETHALTQVNSCRTLSTDGETYEITTDLSSPGTCLTLTANNIVLDLKGHTIRFGSGNAEDSYGVHNSGSNNIVRNGIIIQEGRPTTDNNGHKGIYWTSTTGTLENMDVRVYAHDTHAVEIAGWSEPCSNTGTATIRNNTLANYGTTLSSRDAFTSSALRLTRPNSKVNILGNRILASPQTGINWVDIDWDYLNRPGRRGCGDGSQIAYNTITINDAKYANPAGIICYQCPALSIHHNTLNGQGMEGIQLDNAFNQNGETRTLIHDNTINLDGNYHSAGHSAGPGEIQGIRIRYRPEHIDIYNNNITINADDAPGTEQNNAYGIWLTAGESGPAKDIHFWNNRINVATDGVNNIVAEAIHIDGVDKSTIEDVTFKNNHFESNHRTFAAGYNGPWTQPYDTVLFQNNTLKKSSGTTHDYATHAIYYASTATSVFKIVDPIYDNGASKTDIDILSYSGANLGGQIYYTLTARVQNPQGQGQQGATVSAQDAYGASETCTTGTAGECTMILLDYERLRTGGAKNFPPYTITARHSDQELTQNTNLGEPTRLTFTLGSSVTPTCTDNTQNGDET
ncbi:MAG: hypothetical protein HC945_03690, partial [Nitrosarchaeum sp.]|nr:hypothetical protein [Nitrosarchaeum sp.]